MTSNVSSFIAKKSDTSNFRFASGLAPDAAYLVIVIVFVNIMDLKISAQNTHSSAALTAVEEMSVASVVSPVVVAMRMAS